MIHQNKEDCHFRTFLDASLANNRELVLCIINTHSVSLAFLFRFKAGNLCILMSSFISKWDIRKSTLSLHQLIKDYCGHFSEHFGWRRLREASRDCVFFFFHQRPVLELRVEGSFGNVAPQNWHSPQMPPNNSLVWLTVWWEAGRKWYMGSLFYKNILRRDA